MNDSTDLRVGNLLDDLPDAAGIVELLEQQRSTRRTLILGDDDVRDLLSMSECIELQAAALSVYSTGHAVSLERISLGSTESGVKAALMPARVPIHQALGSKLLISAPANRQRGLPRSMSTLTMLDYETGFPLAWMSSTYLTNLRTAATAVLAASTLASRSATNVGIYGSGPIARLFVEALPQITSVQNVVIYSPTPAHRDALAHHTDGIGGLHIRSSSSPAEAARSDIVFAATDGRGPAFDSSLLEPGVTVISAASRPHTAEIPVEALVGARVVVDGRASAEREAGEFLLQHQPPPTIYAELGELLTGRHKGRQAEDERWVFKATGLAVQDVLTARAVLIRALSRGAGTSLRLVS